MASARKNSKSSGISVKVPRRGRSLRARFAVCLADSEPDLQVGKIYRVLPDAVAAHDRYLRVIDESDEDYLYPEQYFTFLELPKEAVNALTVNGHTL